MIKPLIENPILKLVTILVLFGLSWWGINSDNFGFVGYLSLFGALFIIFETYKLQLFWKILIALALGLILALSAIKGGFFEPADLTVLKPVGSKIFMNCLTMALVPLVFCSILTGVTSLGDIKRLNVIGLRTIIYYVVTTGIAITIGLGLANAVQPGRNLSPEIRTKFEQNFKSSAESDVKTAEANKQTLFEGLVSIFPQNIFSSISAPKPDMLGLIFFAIICGMALLQIEDRYSDPVIRVCTGVTEMTVRIVVMVMRLAPYGVFALIVSTISQTQSTEFITALIPFSLLVIFALGIHLFGMNSLSLKFLSKQSPLAFFKKVRTVAMTAFSTSSSGATMPFTLEVTEKELGVRNEIAGFVVPLGATINMDGTALFQGVSTIFLANIYGIELSLIDQLVVIGMTVMASIGTAAVPGVGIVILTMVLVSVKIPPEGILFILPVNNLLDMFRTVVNVTGDMACSVYIDSYDRRQSAAVPAG